MQCVHVPMVRAQLPAPPAMLWAQARLQRVAAVAAAAAVEVAVEVEVDLDRTQQRLEEPVLLEDQVEVPRLVPRAQRARRHRVHPCRLPALGEILLMQEWGLWELQSLLLHFYERDMSGINEWTRTRGLRTDVL
jgi:hypothetical protein